MAASGSGGRHPAPRSRPMGEGAPSTETNGMSAPSVRMRHHLTCIAPGCLSAMGTVHQHNVQICSLWYNNEHVV
jgi:hypothetical protein